MRSVFTLLVILGAGAWLLGCPGDRDVPPPSPDPYAIPGSVTEAVTIHVMPAAASSPHTVMIRPDLPIYEVTSAGLVFHVKTPPGTTPRWARVEVKDFSLGTPNADCVELGNKNDPSPCSVTFSTPTDPTVFKYSIALYEQTIADAPDAEPDLVIDPVGIIKG